MLLIYHTLCNIISAHSVLTFPTHVNKRNGMETFSIMILILNILFVSLYMCSADTLNFGQKDVLNISVMK
jgi:hypothetical protein